MDRSSVGGEPIAETEGLEGNVQRRKFALARAMQLRQQLLERTGQIADAAEEEAEEAKSRLGSLLVARKALEVSNADLEERLEMRRKLAADLSRRKHMLNDDVRILWAKQAERKAKQIVRNFAGECLREVEGFWQQEIKDEVSAREEQLLSVADCLSEYRDKVRLDQYAQSSGHDDSVSGRVIKELRDFLQRFADLAAEASTQEADFWGCSSVLALEATRGGSLVLYEEFRFLEAQCRRATADLKRGC